MSEWTEREEVLLGSFKRPYDIQRYLDGIEYNPAPEARSPRFVMRNGRAHCFEGALFAACALRRLGLGARLLDLGAWNDDDHVIAVFRDRGRWGAVAKSNFTTLRFREPVYRSLRELSMSYFDFYFNTKGEKTLRSYSRLLDLSRFDHRDWERTEEDLEYIGDALSRVGHYEVLSDEMVRALETVPPYMLEAGLIGSRPEGLFKPE
jgi:hypothetical protein